MKDYKNQFLYLFRCALEGERAPGGYAFSADEVFSLASVHNVLPLIFSALPSDFEKSEDLKKACMINAVSQTRKNLAFASLYASLCGEKIDITVLKGPVCASLYPQPDLRLSSDFDILIDFDDDDFLDLFFKENGFKEKNGSYFNEKNGLYIEVKLSPAEGTGRLRRQAEKMFDGFENRRTFVGGYKTLSYTDNMLYLIYHAFRHFTGSGFGVRQLADIALFALSYREKIDFGFVFGKLGLINAEGFAYNIFNTAEKVFDFDFSFIVKNAPQEILCHNEFIEDLLNAGIFGKSSENRLHSAAAVSSSVENGSGSRFRSVLSSAFPGYSVMKNKYPILSRLPFLLPLFWLVRIVHYVFKAIFKRNRISPSESIKIADERTLLMKKMGIIKRK